MKKVTEAIKDLQKILEVYGNLEINIEGLVKVNHIGIEGDEDTGFVVLIEGEQK